MNSETNEALEMKISFIGSQILFRNGEMNFSLYQVLPRTGLWIIPVAFVDNFICIFVLYE